MALLASSSTILAACSSAFCWPAFAFSAASRKISAMAPGVKIPMYLHLAADHQTRHQLPAERRLRPFQNVQRAEGDLVVALPPQLQEVGAGAILLGYHAQFLSSHRISSHEKALPSNSPKATQ